MAIKGHIPWDRKGKNNPNWRGGLLTFQCLICKNEFKVNPCRGIKVKYCSLKCMGIANKGKRHSNLTRQKMRKNSPHLSGEKHPRWKGGKHKNSSGYVLIYQPKHPHKNSFNCVLEHRLIIERYLGRYLKPGEVVHHLNGIVDDNRFENLALCNNKTHHIFIKKLQEKIRELELLTTHN